MSDSRAVAIGVVAVVQRAAGATHVRGCSGQSAKAVEGIADALPGIAAEARGQCQTAQVVVVADILRIGVVGEILERQPVVGIDGTVWPLRA